MGGGWGFAGLFLSFSISHHRGREKSTSRNYRYREINASYTDPTASKAKVTQTANTQRTQPSPPNPRLPTHPPPPHSITKPSEPPTNKKETKMAPWCSGSHTSSVQPLLCIIIIIARSDCLPACSDGRSPAPPMFPMSVTPKLPPLDCSSMEPTTGVCGFDTRRGHSFFLFFFFFSPLRGFQRLLPPAKSLHLLQRLNLPFFSSCAQPTSPTRRYVHILPNTSPFLNINPAPHPNGHSPHTHAVIITHLG